MRDSRSETGGNVRPKKTTVVSVSFNQLKQSIDFLEKCVTRIDRWHSDQNSKEHETGVYGHLSLKGIVDYINSLKGTLKKDEVPALLKGIYNHGTGGVYCEIGADILFYDIDVKDKVVKGKVKKENVHLFDSKTNSDVFDYLKTISIFTARSDSKYGIFGALYVPGLGKYLHGQKDEHKIVGDHIVAELSKLVKTETGITVKFDDKQNTFRQIRNIAVQSEHIELNMNPLQVDFTVKHIDTVTSTGVPLYVYTNNTGYEGSIRYQFNCNNSIEDALLNCGFKQTSTGRYYHPATSSDSTGQVNLDTNTFYSHSESFGVGLFTPYDLHVHTQGIAKEEFNKQLKAQGYKHIPVEKSEIDKAIDRLNHDQNGTEDIYEICFPLRSLSPDDKYDIMDKLDLDYQRMKYVHRYLEIPEMTITYDYKLEIEKYLSESISEIDSIINANQKVCICAGTGYGKTRAFVDYFKGIDDKKAIILAPLQAIASQIGEEYGIPYLTGDSAPQNHSKAKTTNIFAATYEQAIKHIQSGSYDYIIIDEFHNLLTANEYKEDVISSLYEQLEETNAKVIGLTGTPSNIIRMLGFKMVQVVKKEPEEMVVIECFTNRKAHFTVINHVLNNPGKSIFRFNNHNDIKSVKQELIENHGHKDRDILVLSSTRAIKKSEAYNKLIKEGMFEDHVKIILATGVIDEGLNIYQDDFENIVYIDANSYYPRPEPIKQFFARIRRPSSKAKYYLYRKFAQKQSIKYCNDEENLITVVNSLEKENKEANSYSTYTDIPTNDRFYIKSSGKVNKPHVAYQITQTGFHNYTPSMLDRFLVNYHIVISRDENFKQKPLNPVFKKTWDLEAKTALKDVWINQKETIYSVIGCESSDPELRKTIDYGAYQWDEEFVEFVYQNIKAIEKYYKYELRFLKLGVDPDKYIVGEKALASPQKLNNTLYFLESMAVMNNPINEADKITKERLEEAIGILINKGTFNRKDIESVFNKHTLIIKPSIEVVVKLVKEFAEVTYNKQTKTYRVKKNGQNY